MDERAMSFKDRMAQFRDSQIIHGLELAYEANDAYSEYVLHKIILDHSFTWANSETIEVYSAIADEAHATFERFVNAAGVLIGIESGKSSADQERVALPLEV